MSACLQGDRLLHRGRPDLVLQTGSRGREAESEEAHRVDSARLSTLFPADIAVFTGSAAQPRTPVCKTFGCFNDASTWTPSGLAGAAGMRSYRKWRYVLESSFTPLSDADNRFLQLPPPRLAFLVCVRIASHCRDTSWGCGARPEPSWRACRVGKCSPSHALSEPPRRPGQRPCSSPGRCASALA